MRETVALSRHCEHCRLTRSSVRPKPLILSAKSEISRCNSCIEYKKKKERENGSVRRKMCSLQSIVDTQKRRPRYFVSSANRNLPIGRHDVSGAFRRRWSIQNEFDRAARSRTPFTDVGSLMTCTNEVPIKRKTAGGGDRGANGGHLSRT